MADDAEGLTMPDSKTEGTDNQDADNTDSENQNSGNSDNQESKDKEQDNKSDKTDSDKKESKESDKESDKKSDDDQPIEYTDFNISEGFSVADSDVSFFKELRLSQEQAQKVIDYETERVKSLQQQLEQAQLEAFDKQATEWLADAKFDKEFGGQDYEKNLGIANTAIAKLGSDKLVDVLSKTGLANHPEMIRFAFKAGQLLSEDSTSNDAPGGREKTRAEKLYPNQS